MQVCIPARVVVENPSNLLQEVEIMKSLTFDNNVCQFYGTCPKGNKTLLLLEFLEVRLC